jgi:hypothetical protein
LNAAGDVVATNPAYYLPLKYYSSIGETIYVRFTERADLKQAYQLTFSLQATGDGLDAPTISPITDKTTDEDTPLTVSFTVNDPNLEGDDFAVSVVSSNQTLLPDDRIMLSGSVRNWTLTATPALDQSGFATITVTATNVAGLTSTNRFAIWVNPVNDAPTYVDLVPSATLASIQRVRTQLLRIAASEADGDASTNDNSGLALILENTPGAIVGTLATEDPDGNEGAGFTLLFDPSDMFEVVGNQLQLKGGVAADFEALSSVFLIVQATDNGGMTFEQDFTVDIGDVNEAPSFHVGGSVSATDDSPLQVYAGWAANLSTGPNVASYEAGQSLNFFVTNDNNNLFVVPPTIDSGGNLTFTPRPNAYGNAVVTVELQDDGGTANGGINASLAQQFNITITKPHRLFNAVESGSRRGLDVTGSTSPAPDGFIVAGDVLAVINYINSKGSGHISDSIPYGPPYCDVNGDDAVVADDVIRIINYINAHPGQSEASDPAMISATDFAAPSALDSDIAGLTAETSVESIATKASIEQPARTGIATLAIPNDLIILLAADLAGGAAKRRRTPA